MSSLLKISVSILLFFLSVTASGNPYRFSAGAAEAGMGSLCITRNGFWSQFSNQALHGFNKSFAAGINYENSFGISELGTRTVGIIIPAGRTSLGFVYSNFGYPDFRRKSGGISCGMALSDMISGGVRIDYFSEKTSGEYDARKTITCEAGMLIMLSEKVTVGMHIFNPVPNSLRRSFLPSTIRAAAGIELSKVLFAGVEAEMSSMEKLIIRTGFEYEAFTKIWLRGGFSSENTSFTFGTGYLFKSIKLDLGFATHDRLGVTSSVSLIFKIY